MKTILLLLVTMFALASCVTCPHKDVVYYIATPLGPIPAEIEKDFFSKDNEGNYYMDKEKYQELMEEEIKGELKEQSEEVVEELDKDLGI